jgi:hypothetical protein
LYSNGTVAGSEGLSQLGSHWRTKKYLDGLIKKKIK